MLRNKLADDSLALKIFIGLSVLIVFMGLYFIIVFRVPNQFWLNPSLCITLYVLMKTMGTVCGLTLSLFILLQHHYKAVDSNQQWMGYVLLGIGVLNGFCTVLWKDDNFIWFDSLVDCMMGVWLALIWIPHPILDKLAKRNSLFLSLIFISGIGVIYLQSETYDLIKPGLIPNTIGGMGFLLAMGFFLKTYRLSSRPSDLLFAGYCLLFFISIPFFQSTHLWETNWWFSQFLQWFADLLLWCLLFELIKKTLVKSTVYQRRLHIINELAPTGIFYTDLQGSFQYVNEKFTKITGMALPVVSNNQWTKHIHQHDKDKVITQWEQTIEKQLVFSSYFRLYPISGGTIWVFCQALPEKDTNDIVIGYMGTLTDVSEVKQAEEQLSMYHYYLEEMVVIRTNELIAINQKLKEEIAERRQIEIALRENEAQFAAILNISAEAIISVDELQRIVLFSQGAEKIFEYSVQEVLGKPLDVLLPDSLVQIHRHHIDRFAEETKDARHMGESQCIMAKRKNGQLFSAEGSISKTNKQGKTLFTAILRDVSARRESEKALKQSEERYMLATRSGKVGVWDWNITDNLLYISPYFKELLGFKEQEITDEIEVWLSHVHPVDVQHFKQLCRSYLKSVETDYEFEHRMLDKDNNVHWVLTRGHIMRESNGKATRITGTYTDITERKQVEMALRESEEKYRALIETTHIGYVMTDNAGHVLETNTEYMSLAGHRELNTIYGRNVLAWIAPCDKKTYLQGLEQCAAQGWIKNLEIHFVNPKGGMIPVEISAMRMNTRQGIRLLALCKDISERKRAEHALKISEQKYRTLLNDASDTILLLDTKGYITEANKQAETLFGYNRTELLKKHISDLHPAEELQQTCVAYNHHFDVKLCSQATDGKCRKNNDTLILKKTGEIVPVDVTCNLIEYADKQGLLKIIRDTSERKKAELALQRERASLAQRVEERTTELMEANLKLAKASRLKDEFLANVSHELRTPLNAILTLSEGLQEQVFGSLNDKQLKYLNSIYESGVHLLAVINDILDLSKIEAGKIELQIEEVNLESLCQSSLRMVRETAQKKHISLVYSPASDVTVFMADERRLKQVLVNLLGNAVKFTQQGGKVGLQLIRDAHNQILQFKVWDTGIGIAKQDMGRLFKPFSQLDSSLSRHYEGTGLGLAIVYRLVGLHNGSIQLDSEVGQGSQFTVSIPYQIPPAITKESLDTPLPKPTMHPPEPNAPLILIAEDNTTNLIGLVPYLESQGYRVAVAQDGMHVLHQACELHPVLILMDIQMPTLNGLEAISRIRQVSSLSKTPIIALTGLAMPGDKERCLDSGADAYLSKPFNLKELVHLIRHLLKASKKSQS